MLRPSDAAHFRRTLAGLCLIAAPLVAFLGTVISPQVPEDAAGTLRVVGEHSDRWVLGNLLFVVFLLVLVPALLGLVHLLRHHAVALGHLGGVLSLAGVVGTAGLFGASTMVSAVANQEANQVEMLAVLERAEGGFDFVFLRILFLIGLNLGFIVLAVALWRARIGPRFAPPLMALGMILLFFRDSLLVAVIGTALLAAGLGGMGVSVLSLSDDDWEQPAGVEAAPAEPRVR